MINLQRFCAVPGIDEREYLHRPWRDGDWTYATNGHVIVRTREFDDTVADKHSRSPARAVEMFAEWHNKHGHIAMKPMPELPHAQRCKVCDGAEHFMSVKCPDCDGGMFVHGAHEYECQNCGDSPIGVGFVVGTGSEAKRRPCESCMGRGFEQTTHRLAGTGFELGYLQWLAALPGPVSFSLYPNVNGASGGAFFAFNGGEAILMERKD